MPGKKIRWGAVNSRPISRAIIEPHSASGGWAPSPRNERAATSSTAPAIPRVPATINGVIAFGRIRRKSNPRALSPRALEAVK